MSSSAKTLIGALVVLNVALVGLLLFRDRSVTPAIAAHGEAPVAALPGTSTLTERAGGTAFAPAEPPAVVHIEDSAIDPALEARTAEPPRPVERLRASAPVQAPRPVERAAARPVRETAPAPYEPAPRREPEARVASLPDSGPILRSQDSPRNERPVPEPPRPISVTVPAGQNLAITLDVGLNSRQVRAGDAFEASLVSPLVVDGKQLAPAGSEVTGRIAGIVEAGKTKGVEQMTLTLSELTIAGKAYSIETSRLTMSADNTKDKEAAMIGGAAVVGAIIGGIAGGKKGAAAGAATGAAAGTGVAISTKGKPVTLDTGSRLDFVLSQSLRVLLPPEAMEETDEPAPGVARR